MKLSKADKEQIAQKIAKQYLPTLSKSTPQILHLAARRAKEILEKAKNKKL